MDRKQKPQANKMVQQVQHLQLRLGQEFKIYLESSCSAGEG